MHLQSYHNVHTIIEVRFPFKEKNETVILENPNSKKVTIMSSKTDKSTFTNKTWLFFFFFCGKNQQVPTGVSSNDRFLQHSVKWWCFVLVGEKTKQYCMAAWVCGDDRQSTVMVFRKAGSCQWFQVNYLRDDFFFFGSVCLSYLIMSLYDFGKGGEGWPGLVGYRGDCLNLGEGFITV